MTEAQIMMLIVLLQAPEKLEQFPLEERQAVHTWLQEELVRRRAKT